MSKWAIILLILLAILIVGMVVLYFLGKKAQAKRDEQQAQMDAVAQQATILIIDKKRMKLKDAGLPQFIVEQTPKYMRRAKLPVVKAKIGPKVMSLMCDSKVYDNVLPKQEVKAQVSGIYVTSAKRIRGPLPEPKKTKKELRAEKKAAKAKEKEVKATISVIYITSVKGLRGPLEKPAGKKSFKAKLQERYNKASEQLKAESANADSKNKKNKK